jgi:desulfoferrodoxin (superoxide reductase-like protein)
MKKLSFIIILIIFFQSLTTADDISDFEIEGMSTGESLLDYMDEGTILKLINSKSANYYPNKSFVVFTYNNKSFKIYDNVGIVINPNDSNYIIHSIEGTINMDDCRKKQLEISNELKVFFNNKKYDFFSNKNLDYIDDKSGESKVHYEDFYFQDNSAVRVICWSMSKEFFDKGFKNTLVVAVNSKDFMDWIEKNM